MKIAILSDIHGNKFALEQVLLDLKKRQCDVVLCLGDYLGYYYWPNQVVDMLRALDNSFFIKGNHEDIYFRASQDIDYRKNIKEKYGLGIEFALSEMTEENKLFLSRLEEQKIIKLDGLKIGMFHGSPLDINEYVYPDATEAKLAQLTQANLDVVLLGHTHHQFVSSKHNILFINPGSVGQARDVRGLAAYAILNTSNNSVTPIRLPYDESLVVNKIKKVEKKADKMVKALKGCI